MMLALLLLVLGACGEVPPTVNQEPRDAGIQVAAKYPDDVSYSVSVKLDVDLGTYTIKAEIQTINSLTRQTDPASGGVFGAGGAVSGSFTGEVREGKGILRLKVLESDSSLAPVGSTVIIKTTDSKSLGLLPGDIKTFACRHQEELLDPVMEDQTVSAESRKLISTWELDSCRLKSPALEK